MGAVVITCIAFECLLEESLIVVPMLALGLGLPYSLVLAESWPGFVALCIAIIQGVVFLGTASFCSQGTGAEESRLGRLGFACAATAIVSAVPSLLAMGVLLAIAAAKNFDATLVVIGVIASVLTILGAVAALLKSR